VTNGSLYQSTPAERPPLSVQIAATLSLVSLLLLYLAEARGLRVASRSYATEDILIFLPHLVCLTLLVAGMNRVGGVVTAITAVAYALLGALFALVGLFDRNHAYGMGFLALVQVALFVAAVRAARTRSSTPDIFPSPRHGVALLAAVAVWFGVGLALRRLDAPRRKAEMAEAARQLTERNTKIAEVQFLQVAQCLQRYAPADSAAYYPATLDELAASGDCPRATTAPPTGFTLEYEASKPNASGRRTSFRLVAGSTGSDGGRRTLITDQNEWVVVRSGVGVNQYSDAWSSPLLWLEPIANCIERARDADSMHRYPPTIGAANRSQGCAYQYASADSVTAVLGGPRGRYVVRYTPPSRAMRGPGGYTLSLSPDHDSLGHAIGSAMRSYLVDSAGAIHMALRPRAATVADSVLPPCPERRLALLECNQYLPRQRWGVALQMPRMILTSRGNGLVAIGDTVYFDPQYEPVAEQDSVIEYRFAWRATDPDSVVPIHGRRSVATSSGRDVSFHLRHVYHERGLMLMRFSVLTRGGERYEYRDSIRVLPHAAGTR
jgi:hypothetical protein